MSMLTVDDDDLHHGYRKERQRLQGNFDQNGRNTEDEHDDEQTSHHTQTLRDADTSRGRKSRYCVANGSGFIIFNFVFIFFTC